MGLLKPAVELLALLVRASLLAVAVLRPSTISFVYVALFAIAHQGPNARLALHSSSLWMLTQHAAASVAALIGLLEAVGALPFHDPISACAIHNAPWAPDVAVLCISCIALGLALTIRVIRCTSRAHVETDGTADGDERSDHPYGKIIIAWLTAAMGTVAPLILFALAAALQPGALGMVAWLGVHAILLVWATGAHVPPRVHVLWLPCLAKAYAAVWLLLLYLQQAWLACGGRTWLDAWLDAEWTMALRLSRAQWLRDPTADWYATLQAASLVAALCCLHYAGQPVAGAGATPLRVRIEPVTLRQYTTPLLTEDGHHTEGHPTGAQTMAPSAAEPTAQRDGAQSEIAEGPPATTDTSALVKSAAESFAAPAASGGALCAAISLLAWCAFAPCVLSLVGLCVGLAALQACDRWAYTPSSYYHSGQGTAAASVASSGVLPPLRGSIWIGASLMGAHLWTVSQYAVAAVCATADAAANQSSAPWATPGSPLSMAGLQCDPPLPAIVLTPTTGGTSGATTIALAIQLCWTVWLACCLYVHRTGVRVLRTAAAADTLTAQRPLETDERADTSRVREDASPSRPPVASPPGHAPSEVELVEEHRWSSPRINHVQQPLRSVFKCAEAPMRHARAALIDGMLWHAPTVPLMLVLWAGAWSCDVLHAIWLLLAVWMLGAGQRATRRRWPLLRLYTASATAAQAACLVFAPRTDQVDGGTWNTTSIVGGLIGLRASPTDPQKLLSTGWLALGWPIALAIVLSVQAACYRSPAYRRCAARRGWRRAAAAHAPHVAARRQDASACKALHGGVWRTWGAYLLVLVMALLPPIGLVGATALTALLALLYVHQGSVHATSRARRQRPLWALLAVLMLLALLMRWAFRVPLLYGLLLGEERGVLAPWCNDPAYNGTSRAGATCEDLLRDLGLIRDVDGAGNDYAGAHAILALSAALATIALGESRRAATAASRPALSLYSPPGWLRMLLLRAFGSVATSCLVAAVGIAGVASDNAIGGLYMLILLACSFGDLSSVLWLPAGLLSSLVIIVQYLFQLRLALTWLPADGCDSPNPPSGCDAEWVGLTRLASASASFAHTFGSLLALLAPSIAIQLLALTTRQVQLHRRRAASTDGASFYGLIRHLARTPSAARAAEGTGNGGASSSQGGVLGDTVDGVSSSRGSVPGGPAGMSWLRVAGEIAVRVGTQTVELLAVLSLLVAAAVRLNMWAVVYTAAAGWVRFVSDSRASWLGVRLILVASVALQYAASLSLPPSLLPMPSRRPWIAWGCHEHDHACDDTWSPAAATCSQLGVRNVSALADAPPSGLMCWAALDGQLSTTWLSPDLIAFALATLHAHTADAFQHRAADASTQPLHAHDLPSRALAYSGVLRILHVCEAWVLRAAPPLALLAVFVLACLSSLSAGLGLLTGGYLALSMHHLATHRELYRPTARRAWRVLHFYAWLVPALRLLYQAPLVPLAQPEACAAALGSNEAAGIPWCTLLTATLGLFKLSNAPSADTAASELCATDDHGQMINGACFLSTLGLRYDLLIWLLVDVTDRLLHHPEFQVHVVEWARRRDVAVNEHERARKWLESRRRMLHARRLSAWRALRAAELRRIVSKLHTIEQRLLGRQVSRGTLLDTIHNQHGFAGAQDEPMEPAPSANGHTDAATNAGREADHVINAEDTPLARAAQALASVGFSYPEAELALCACGASANRDVLGYELSSVSSGKMIQALTMLLEVELGIQSASRVAKAAGKGTGRAMAEELSEAVAPAHASDVVAGVTGLASGTSEAPVESSSSIVGKYIASAMHGGELGLRRVLMWMHDPALDTVISSQLLETPSSNGPAPDTSLSGAAEVTAERESSGGCSHSAGAVSVPSGEVEGDGDGGDNVQNSEMTPLLTLLARVLCAHSATLVWATCLLNHTLHANVLSLPYAILPLLYGLLDSPTPHARFFYWLQCYAALLMWIKFTYQLPLFCGSPPLTFRRTASGLESAPAGSSACFDWDASQMPTAEFMMELPSRIDYVLGLHKFDSRSSLPHNEGLLAGTVLDLLVFLALAFHREVSRAGDGGERDGGPHDVSQSVLSPPLPPSSLQRYKRSLSLVVGLVAGAILAIQTASVPVALGGMVGFGTFVYVGIELDRACRLELSRPDRSATIPRKVAMQIRACGSEALGFIDRLLPPAHLSKAGCDLAVWSFGLCLVLFVFCFLFFAQLVRRGGGADAGPLSSSDSTVSSSTVLALLVLSCVMLADRVIYKLWEPPTAIDGGEGYGSDGGTRVHSGEEGEGGEGGEGGATTSEGSDSAEGATGDVTSRRGANKAPALKLALHVVLTIALHVEYGFGMPLWSCDLAACTDNSSTSCCSASSTLIAFYVLCCAYLSLSAAQLRHGMPLILREHPLSDSGDKLSSWLSKGYMAVPFLWELRAAVDWTVDATSLDLFTTLKLEDIYIGLCAVRDNMNVRKMYARGARQPFADKLTYGVLFVLALLAILLGPLLLFSSASILSQPNPLVGASLVLQVSLAPGTTRVGDARLAREATQTLLTSTAASLMDDPAAANSYGAFPLGSISRFNLQSLPPSAPVLTTGFKLYQCLGAPFQNSSSCGYAYLLGDWPVGYQLLRLAHDTDLRWQINPRARHALRDALSANASTVVRLQLALEIQRTLPVAGSTYLTYLAASPPLDAVQRAQMYAAAAPPTGSAGVAPNVSVEIQIDGMLPKFVRLPSVGSVIAAQPLVGTSDDYWHTMQNLTFVRDAQPPTVDARGLATQVDEQWWGVRQAAADASPFDVTASDGPQLVVASDNLVGGAAGSSLASGGLLAFYLAVVVGIGRSIRGVLGGTRYRLMMDEMPDTRDLIDLCEGVYLARREGLLLRETQLTEIMFRLYRSSETLLQLTGSQLKRHGE